MDACRLQDFLVRHVGQDSRQTPGAERLARARRTDQQKVVRPGSGDLQGAFYTLHPDHIREVGVFPLRTGPSLQAFGNKHLPGLSLQKIDAFLQRRNTNKTKTFHQRGLFRIRTRNDQYARVILGQAHRDGQNSPHWLQQPIQRKFAHEDEALEIADFDLSSRIQHPDRQWKI